MATPLAPAFVAGWSKRARVRFLAKAANSARALSRLLPTNSSRSICRPPRVPSLALKKLRRSAGSGSSASSWKRIDPNQDTPRTSLRRRFILCRGTDTAAV